jgi:hypothetical protein
MKRWIWAGDRFRAEPIIWLVSLTLFVVAADLFWRLLTLPGEMTLAIAATAALPWFGVTWLLTRRRGGLAKLERQR